ncbi:glycosyltransferase family 4 protein [Georgenia sp. MJ173]
MEYFENEIGRRHARAHGRTLVFIGKLGSRKSPELVLGALNLLRSEWPSARACFIGPFESAKFGSAFWERAETLGVRSSIDVVGHVENVAEHIGDDASIFVLPSTQEGLPGALAEAMALGLPVAVSTAGAMPMVVEQSGGGEVVERDAAAIAEFVAKLWRTDALWRSYSDSAHSYASEHFSTSAVVSQYLECIVTARH